MQIESNNDNDSYKINVSVIGIDEANQKVDEYIKKLKEAKTLADELASMEFEINVQD